MVHRVLLVAGVLLALLALPSGVMAADITVNQHCSLVDAIIAANEDRAEGGCPAGDGADTITLATDVTISGWIPHIRSEITLEGRDHAISGDGRFFLFIIRRDGNLTINDTKLIDGKGSKWGATAPDGSTWLCNCGGAIINEGILRVNDSVFRNNKATWAGAILNNAGLATIHDSSFKGNQSEKSGGAIMNVAGVLHIRNSVFSDNTAQDNGGVIWNYGGVSITGSAFFSNSALRSAGAIYNQSYDNGSSGRLVIRDSRFCDNAGPNFTRNIVSPSDTNALQLSDDVEFSDDRSDCQNSLKQDRLPPDIPSDNSQKPITVKGDCTLADAILAANRDEAVGGCAAGNGADAIALTGDLTLSESLPGIRSRITISGGGHTISGDDQFRIFDVSDSATLTVRDLRMTNASADLGGAINNRGRLSVYNSEIRDSVALGSSDKLAAGGAIFNDRGSAYIYDSAFHGASASHGGAIASQYGTLRIDNSNFGHNSAGSYGGAIWSYRSDLRVNDSSFVHNSSSYTGGAIYIRRSADIATSSFLSNSAGSGGAVTIYESGSADVDMNVFFGNTATGAGGAFEVERGGLLVATSNLFIENSASNGGAMYLGYNAKRRTYRSKSLAYGSSSTIYPSNMYFDNEGGDCSGC